MEEINKQLDTIYNLHITLKYPEQNHNDLETITIYRDKETIFVSNEDIEVFRHNNDTIKTTIKNSTKLTESTITSFLNNVIVEMQEELTKQKEKEKLTQEEFDRIKEDWFSWNDSQRWDFVIKNQDKNFIVMLDIDDTYLINPDFESEILQFNYYLGDSDGVIEFLEFLNIKSEPV